MPTIRPTTDKPLSTIVGTASQGDIVGTLLRGDAGGTHSGTTVTGNSSTPPPTLPAIVVDALALKADKTTTLTGTGLATTSGNLGANPTVNVPKASAADVSAGTDDTRAVTPLALSLTPALAGKASTATVNTIWHVSSLIGMSPTKTGGQNASALKTWIEARTTTGGRLMFDESYTMDPISVTLIDASFAFAWTPKAKITGTTDFEEPIFRLDGVSVRTTPIFIRFEDARIDCSLGKPDAAQSSAISLSDIDEVYVRPRLYGGTSRTSPNADSGVETVNCGAVLIEGPGYIKGFSDAGVYIGGDNSDPLSPDAEYGATHIVRGPLVISHCNVGVIGKRALRHMLVTGVTFDSNLVDCSANYVPKGADPGPYQQMYSCKRMDCIGNFHRNTGARCWDYRGGSKGMVVGNRAEDVGREENGITAIAGAVFGLFAGAQVEVSDNRVGLKRWTRVDQRGFVTQPETVNGIANAGAGCTFADNRYVNLVTGVQEGSGSTSSHYADEVFETVTTPIGLLAGAGSVATYRIVGDATRYAKIGATTYKEANETFRWVGTGNYLSALGSLAAGAAGAPQSVTATGALNGDLVIVTPNSSGGATPNIIYTARALTDAFQINAKNTSASAIDFTALSYTVMVLRSVSS